MIVMSNESDLKSTEGSYFGPFHLIASQRSLKRQGKYVSIGGKALDILIALTDRPGEVLTSYELIKIVWRRLHVEESTLRVHISSLRKILASGQDGTRYIINISGRGYMFAAPVRRDWMKVESLAQAGDVFLTPSFDARYPYIPT